MNDPQDQPPVSDDLTPLRVKELAPALGVSMSFVYQMRACGFVMSGARRDNQTATVAAARKWIEETGFRMVRGRGQGQLKMKN